MDDAMILMAKAVQACDQELSYQSLMVVQSRAKDVLAIYAVSKELAVREEADRMPVVHMSPADEGWSGYLDQTIAGGRE